MNSHSYSREVKQKRCPQDASFQGKSYLNSYVSYTIFFLFQFSGIFGQESKIFVETFACSGMESVNEEMPFPLPPHIQYRFELFLRELLENTEFGYVLFGDKPVMLEGISSDPFYLPGTNQHRTQVIVSEGIRIWQQIPEAYHRPDLFLHLYKQKDYLFPQWKHFLIVHKKNLLKEAENNLNVIQSITGFSGTASEWAKRFLQMPTFSDAVSRDFRLAGIVLGYGTANALTVGRLDQLELSLIGLWKTPYYCHTDTPHQWSCFSYPALLHTMDSQQFFSYEETEFHHVLQEVQELKKTVKLPPKHLLLQKPFFVFGISSEDEDTKKRVRQYEQCQIEIQDLLKKNAIGSPVLSQLFYPWNTPFVFSDPTVSNSIPNLLAREMCLFIQKQLSIYHTTVKECLASLVKGMAEVEEGENRKTDILNQCSEIAWKQRAYRNWKVSEEWIQKQLENGWVEKEPGRIFYRTVQETTGSLLNFPCEEVCITYRSSFPNETCDAEIEEPTWVGADHFTWISTNHLFPGFIAGIMGMRKGEIRQLLIHPSRGYPLHAPVEPLIGRNVTVQLHDFRGKKENHEIDTFLLPTIEELQRSINTCPAQEAAAAYGYIFWDHIQKMQEISFGDMVQEVVLLAKRDPTSWTLTEEEKIVLNLEHLRFYDIPK